MSRRSGNPARRTVSPGLKIEARHKHHADIQMPPSGHHLWVVTGMWHLTNPTPERFDLDIENLLTIEGPGCFICEQTWSREMASEPCPGGPS